MIKVRLYRQLWGTKILDIWKFHIFALRWGDEITYGPEFFQVLFTTTRFSSVLSCEDLLISYTENCQTWQGTAKPYNLMSTNYYLGHLNCNYPSIPRSAKLYVLHINVTRPSSHNHWVRALKASSSSRIWALRFLRIYLKRMCFYLL